MSLIINGELKEGGKVLRNLLCPVVMKEKLAASMPINNPKFY